MLCLVSGSLSLLLFYYLYRINWKTYPWYIIVSYNQNWDKVDSGLQGHGRQWLSRIHCGESSHFRVSTRWSPRTGWQWGLARCVKVTEPWPGQLGAWCSLACREDGKSKGPDWNLRPDPTFLLGEQQYSVEMAGQTICQAAPTACDRQHQSGTHRPAKCPVCGVHGSWLYFSEGYNCSAFESEMENVWHIWCGEDRKVHWKEYGLRGQWETAPKLSSEAMSTCVAQATLWISEPQFSDLWNGAANT